MLLLSKRLLQVSDDDDDDHDGSDDGGDDGGDNNYDRGDNNDYGDDDLTQVGSTLAGITASCSSSESLGVGSVTVGHACNSQLFQDENHLMQSSQF